MDNVIQVAGRKIFPQERWREALLYYVMGILADDHSVMYRPKIYMPGFTLDLMPKSGVYRAYPHDEIKDRVNEKGRVIRKTAVIESGARRGELEPAIIRFVKDDNILVLRMFFPGYRDDAQLTLEKHGLQRGILRASAVGVWTEADNRRYINEELADLRADLRLS